MLRTAARRVQVCCGWRRVRLSTEKSMTTVSFWLREGEESEVPGARDGDNTVAI